MVILPSIRARRRDKKRFATHVYSSIFKNGLTWFDIDSALDPYNLSWHKYIPLHQQTEEYFQSKNELVGKRVIRPLNSDFDEGNISSYAERDPFRTKNNVPGRLLEIEKCEQNLKKGWITLERDELDFKASVNAYNKFVNDNKQKRETSHQKITYFKSRSKDLMNKINSIRKNISKLQKVIVKMKENYKIHRIYYVFCTDAAHLDGLHSPISLIGRYLAIKDVEEFAYGRLLTMVQKYTTMYSKLKKIEADRNDVIHALIMQFNELKKRYEEASTRTFKSQQFYNLVREKCQNLRKCTYQTIHGISAIYKYIRARKTETSHIANDKIIERLLYISSKIKKLEDIGRSTRSIKSEEEIQTSEVETRFSDFVVNLNDNSMMFRNSSEDIDNIKLDTIPLKEHSTLLNGDSLHVKGDILMIADPLHMTHDIIHIEDIARNVCGKRTVLPRLNRQNTRCDQKRATFSASLVSYRSMRSNTSSRTKLPVLMESINASYDIPETKKQEISSYERRKIFDKKLDEARKKLFSKTARLKMMKQRQEKRLSAKYKNKSKNQKENVDVGIETAGSHSNQFLIFERPDIMDFEPGESDLGISIHISGA